MNQKTTLAIPKQDANEVSETATAFNDNSTQQDDGKYGAYHSIFELYPLLRGLSRSMSSDPDFPSHLSSNSSLHTSPSTRTSLSSSPSVLAEPSSYFLSSSSLPELNLDALKLAAIGKVLHPFKRICRYEVPGGGTCRDEGCDDVHLSRLQGVNMEPSGTCWVGFFFGGSSCSGLFFKTFFSFLLVYLFFLVLDFVFVFTLLFRRSRCGPVPV